jgi:Tfp pilus assembly protein PilV
VLSSRLRNQEGMTLPEVTVTLAIAMIISLATFALVDTVMRRTGEINARVDTTQRSRTAMDQITRQLRSQVCAWRADPSWSGARSIDTATPTSVGFFTDLSDEVTGTAPDLRTLSLANGTIVETSTKAVRSPVDPAKVSYPNPVTSRTVLTHVSVPPGKVLFSYFAFDMTKSPPVPSTTPLPMTNGALTPAQVEQVAKISITFKVSPTNGGKRGTTTLLNDVYVRTADPNASTPRPTCLTT